MMALPRFLRRETQATATLTLDNVEGTSRAPTTRRSGRVRLCGPLTGSAVGQPSTEGQRQEHRREPSRPRPRASRNVSLNVTGPGNYYMSSAAIRSRRAPLGCRRAMCSARLSSRAQTLLSGGGLAVELVRAGLGLWCRCRSRPSRWTRRRCWTRSTSIRMDAPSRSSAVRMPLLYAQPDGGAGRTQDAGRPPQFGAGCDLDPAEPAGRGWGHWPLARRATVGARRRGWAPMRRTSCSAPRRLGYVVPDAALDKAYDALEEFAVREQPYSTELGLRRL